MLEKIKNPRDVQSLTIEELQKLAREIRDRIIDVTSRNGGHLAPSLGATDIAIALLHVFDPIETPVVWDVGHQSYAWKILTGRNDRFDTLRTYGGISGFNNPAESPYDAFGVGHSSTSISAALGIHLAMEKKNPEHRTVAVIGDGSLTAGIAFEGINQVGMLQRNMIVILNDNNMSISRNVGALQKYLTNVLVSRTYNVAKDRIWSMSQHLPDNFRDMFVTKMQKLEESFINIFVPNILFEDLGFKYIGPIDGNDIERLVHILNNARNHMVGPILIHAITQKGKGCTFAEEDAEKFHGIGPYQLETGKRITKGTKSWSQTFGETITRLADEQDNIVAITAAMKEGCGLSAFARKHPDRFYDVGIAEQHAVTFSGGLAIRGVKPFTALYSTFLQRAYDQIIHDIALQNLPVVFCLDRGGLVGDDGATHHGVFDLSFLRIVPNMMIMAPGGVEEFRQMLQFAAEWKDGPIAIRYPRGPVFEDAVQPDSIVPGKGQILHQGNDVALVGVGRGVNDALETANILKTHDLDCTVVNARFIKPLDTALLIELARSHSRIVTIEDNAEIGGFGEAVRSFLANEDTPVTCFAIPDRFIPHGDTTVLRETLGLLPAQIADSILGMPKRS